MQTLKFKRLNPEAVIPTRAHSTDAGLDLTAVESVLLEPGQPKIVKTGLAMALDPGFVGLIWDRSSMGKKGIKTQGGVIDAGYRGEIGVILTNLTAHSFEVKAGDRIAQLLIQPVATPQTLEVQDLDDTTRGAGGFGSSGR